MRQDVGAERVAKADDGPRHLGTEDIGEMQEVPGQIVPAGVITELLLVQLPAVTLVRDVGYPDAADPELVCGVLGLGVEVGP
jgi:hypothetical protein